MGNVNDKNTSEEKDSSSDRRKENFFRSKVECKKYTCTWKVENVCCMTDGFRCWSPLFPCTEESDTKWLLRICVNADKNSEERFLSLFVKLCSSKTNDVCIISTLEVVSGTQRVLRTDEPMVIGRDRTWGHHRFAPLSECCDSDDSITLRCEIKIPLNKTTTDPLPTEKPLPECRLSHDFHELLRKGDFSDVTLVSSDGHKFKAHRAMLAARSPVFSVMFDHSMAETLSGCVDVPDFNSDVLSALLHFIYTENVPSSLENIVDKLLEAADKYDMTRLRVACENELLSRLTVSNAASALILAERHQLPAMKAGVQSFIMSNLTAVTATKGWKDAVIMCQQTVLELLSAKHPVKT